MSLIYPTQYTFRSISAQRQSLHHFNCIFEGAYHIDPLPFALAIGCHHLCYHDASPQATRANQAPHGFAHARTTLAGIGLEPPQTRPVLGQIDRGEDTRMYCEGDIVQANGIVLAVVALAVLLADEGGE